MSVAVIFPSQPELLLIDKDNWHRFVDYLVPMWYRHWYGELSFERLVFDMGILFDTDEMTEDVCELAEHCFRVQLMRANPDDFPQEFSLWTEEHRETSDEVVLDQWNQIGIDMFEDVKTAMRVSGLFYLMERWVQTSEKTKLMHVAVNAPIVEVW